MNGSESTNVLVIDDSEVARAMMVNLLKDAGIGTLSLASAIGATRLILRSGVRVVVADISMPGLSGDKLVRVLRGVRRLEYLKIVLVSGLSDTELQEVRLLPGVDVVLAKRDIGTSLVPTVSRCLSSAALELRP